MEARLRTAEITSKKKKGGRHIIADLKVTKMMKWLDGSTDSMDVNRGKLRDGEGQGCLAGCNPWGPKELDAT